LRCEPTNILFDWAFESDINRIEQHDDRIVLRYGSMGLERTIDLNATEHPPDIQPSRAGHSIGRWEDDVLVVETIGFAPGILSADGRVPHSERLRVQERFSLDPETNGLRRRYVAEDPLYFEGQYMGADAVYPSDLPFERTPCDGRSYKSGTASGRSLSTTFFWVLVPAVVLTAAVWWLERRLGSRRARS
jgi:hypothetical protein